MRVKLVSSDTLRENRQQEDLSTGIGSLLASLGQAAMQHRQSQAASDLGGQLNAATGMNVPQSAYGQVNPQVVLSMLAQHAGQQQQQQAYAQRDDIRMKAQQEENKLREMQQIRELGSREDIADRQLDQRRAELEADAARYARWNETSLERERMQQQGQNFRTGVQELGDTVRGIGGGIKDMAVAAMRRRPGTGSTSAEGFGLSADANRLYEQKKSQRDQIQNELYQWNVAVGKVPNKDGLMVSRLTPEQQRQAFAEIDRLNQIDAALGGEMSQMDQAARGGQLASPEQSPLTDEQQADALMDQWFK